MPKKSRQRARYTKRSKKAKRKGAQQRAYQSSESQIASQPKTVTKYPQERRPTVATKAFSGTSRVGFDYSYVVSDLKRIGIIAGAIFIILIVLVIVLS